MWPIAPPPLLRPPFGSPGSFPFAASPAAPFQNGGVVAASNVVADPLDSSGPFQPGWARVKDTEARCLSPLVVGEQSGSVSPVRSAQTLSRKEEFEVTVTGIPIPGQQQQAQTPDGQTVLFRIPVGTLSGQNLRLAYTPLLNGSSQSLQSPLRDSANQVQGAAGQSDPGSRNGGASHQRRLGQWVYFRAEEQQERRSGQIWEEFPPQRRGDQRGLSYNVSGTVVSENLIEALPQDVAEQDL